MRKFVGSLAALAALAGSLTPAAADGWRHAARAHWRGSAYAFDRITYNVITPYYYPYYGSHYSYVRPDPVPPPTYVVYPPVVPVCWSATLVLGPRLWVC
ncbi:MAG TPA: hypothetical protein VH934_12735 [Xanthobacteraceae bacterium]